jgi:hypothetical protein
VPDPDGTLHDWNDIADEHPWDTLLLGNGLSINVWEPFAYRELYDHARRGTVLSDQDRELFAGTPNFERVLGDIRTAIRVGECVGVDCDPLYPRYRNIQHALGKAVREVHVNRNQVPIETRKKIRKAMKDFDWIFTTSYDLLIYWAMACEDGFRPFVDRFRGRKRLDFDRRMKLGGGAVPVYFLHGALHLVVGGSGVTWKLRRGLDTLLDQFGEPIPEDPRARPLLVTEGSSTDKLEVIEGNEYLSYALGALRKRKLPAVVFGSSLGEHDTHITDALSANPGRPVAVSMMPGTKKELSPRQWDIYGRIEAESLLFYDARTHPLGDPALNVPAAALRKPPKRRRGA